MFLVYPIFWFTLFFGLSYFLVYPIFNVGVFGLPYFQTTVIINNLAKAYAESGKYKLAEEMAKEAVRIAESTQNSHLSRFLANLGTILNLEGIP